MSPNQNHKSKFQNCPSLSFHCHRSRYSFIDAALPPGVQTSPMRSLWAGLLLLLCLTTAASAQATGYVQELGFGGRYRADCWVPLLVHLDSTYSQPAEYQIQVHQQDLDQDTVIYTRTVTL